MNQDGEHLRLLSVFHYVFGGVTAFFGCFPILYVVIGIADLAGQFGHGHRPPGSDAFGWMFVILGGTMVLLAWSLAAAMMRCGWNLAARRAYRSCQIVAVMECVLIPFGTLLGVFTIIVLMRPSVRKAFGMATDHGTAEPGVYA
jgi:hypothetical protein